MCCCFFLKAGLWKSIITGYTNVFECLQKILIEGKLEVKGPSQLKNSLLLRCNLFCCWYVFLLISGTWRALELTSIRSERPVYVLLHCAYSYAIAQHSDQLPGQVRSLCASFDTTGKHSGVKGCQKPGLISHQFEKKKCSRSHCDYKRSKNCLCPLT